MKEGVHLWDLFISHASEDKETIVRELVNELQKYDMKVWYDEFSLETGDSLSRMIDKGLQESRYGLVILSPAFFQKGWTDYELRSLLTKEIAGRTKVILPIWHEIGFHEVADYSLYLADKYALSTSIGVAGMARKIAEVVKGE